MPWSQSLPNTCRMHQS